MIRKKLINDFYLISLLFCFFLITACGQKPNTSLPGYFDGKYVYISSAYSGILQKLDVNPGDIVKVGQQLFVLEALPESADLQIAAARVQEATNTFKKVESNYDFQKTQMQRKLYLFKNDVISKEEFQNFTSTYMQVFSEMQAAKATMDAQNASLNKAKWAAQQKIVNAPLASLVFDTYYSQGEFVPSGNPVLSLLAASEIKIIFFISEPALSQVKLNQLIDVTCDGCNGVIQGKISYISTKSEYTPPVIYSNEERAKLVYRIEAIPLVTNVLGKIHPGQPISINLNVPQQKNKSPE